MDARAMRYLGQPGEPANPVRRDHLQHLLLNSGRMLVLGGMLLAMSTVGNSAPKPAQSLLGFLMLLVGASLVMLSPVARQFPRAARVGVAVANAVFDHLAVRRI